MKEEERTKTSESIHLLFSQKLYDYNGCTLEFIAKEFGIALSTAKDWISKFTTELVRIKNKRVVMQVDSKTWKEIMQYEGVESTILEKIGLEIQSDKMRNPNDYKTSIQNP